DDPWWEEVLLLYAGLTPDASPLLRKLLEYDTGDQLQEDLFQSNLILAGRCLAASPTIQQPSLWEIVINRLFDALTSTRYSLTKEQIASTLAAIGGMQVNRRLLRLLSSDQIAQSIRKSIASAL